MFRSPEAKGLGLECVFTSPQKAKIQKEAMRTAVAQGPGKPGKAERLIEARIRAELYRSQIELNTETIKGTT